jgi:C4-dicarboxylate-specific signal transduction histidine kinase
MVSIALLALLGFIVYAEITGQRAPEDDTSWAVFELGFEHQRLLLAAEKGESLEEIKLRGGVYLSRVMLLRDSPMLAGLRKRLVGPDMNRLYQSAQATQSLVNELDRLEARDALLWQLRADARMVRTLMLDVSTLNRRLNAEKRAEHRRHLLFYLVLLEVLTLALLGLSVLVFRISRTLRRAGRELAGQLATQDAILRSVDSAIVGVGSCGAVLYSNPNALALLGPAAGRGARLINREGEAHGLLDEVAALFTAAGKPGTSAVRKVRIGTEAGVRHYVIRLSTTQTDPAPDMTGEAPETASHIIAVTDMTEAEEAAIQRSEYDVRLGEASRLLAYAAISGGIVHEISQPLAAIRNYIHALKVAFSMRSAPDDHLAIADRLADEVDRAIEVVRNVRRMGPADPQDSGVCDIHEAVSNSVRLATLGCNPPPQVAIAEGEGRALIAGSLPMVGQVIVNLLKNALGASQAAGRSGAEITVRLEQDHAEISVADHGAGVSDDAARTMFQPFSKSARGGMGLGLAICQRIASSLGGTISWENRGCGGAVFRFTVPLAREGSVL